MLKESLFSAGIALSCLASVSAQSPRITEFLSFNSGPLADEDHQLVDWLELYNPSTTTLSLAGWFLTDKRSDLTRWQFPEVRLPAGESLVVFASGKDRTVPGKPLHTSFSLSLEGSYLALVRPDGETIEQEFAPEYPTQVRSVSFGYPMSADGVLATAPTYLEPTPGVRNPSRGILPRLVLTELMYHPAPPPAGSPWNESQFGFIELLNQESTPLELTGAHFSDGIEFVFPEFALAPGRRLLVVANRQAFASRYGMPGEIAGEYTGTLSGSGERLTLRHAGGVPFFDFSFSDSWHRTTDGVGFSLVPRDETHAAAGDYARAETWRASHAPGGSPGQADGPSTSSGESPADIPSVRINEVLSRAAPPYEDAIELYNPGEADADVSGWYLTDDFDKPQKYRLPPGAIVPAHGFLALDEHTFNGPNDDPLTPGFGLGDFGEEVYLFSADPSGTLSGYVHGFQFETAATNVSFGRHVDSLGREHFVPQTALTFLATNSGVRTGPVLISEIHYNPARADDGSRDEFIELHNISEHPVPLFDPEAPTNTWRLRDSAAGTIRFDFPAGFTFPPHSVILVTAYAPTNASVAERFIRHYPSARGIPWFGPWAGLLGNGGARLELLRPDPPEPNFVPYILVDGVTYADGWPWPDAADGSGASLHRVKELAFGDDPDSWSAGPPSPGVPGLPPSIWRQPGNQTCEPGASAFFAANVHGSSPLTYQWFFNSFPIAKANGRVLTLTHVQPSNQGTYACRIDNQLASTITAPASLVVVDRIPPEVQLLAPSSLHSRASATPLFLSGAATDNLGLRTVFTQRPGEAPLPADGTATWSTTLHLEPGINFLSLFALDTTGNYSRTNFLSIYFEPDPLRLGLIIEGAGLVAGASPGAVLRPGRSYTLRAKPAPGHFFSQWIDWQSGETSTNLTLRFVMTPGRVLTATFLPHRFLNSAGEYEGLFMPSLAPEHGNAGYVRLRLTSRGTFSGRFGDAAGNRSLSGQFDEQFQARLSVVRPDGANTSVFLQLEPTSGQLLGFVTAPTFISPVLGHRVGWENGSALTALRGTYSLQLTTMLGGSNIASAASLAISPTGLAILRGRLPDRTRINARLRVANSAQALIYLPYEHGHSSVFGWFHLENGPSIRGTWHWSRPAPPSVTNLIEVTGYRP